MAKLLEKCDHYDKTRIRQVFVIDPHSENIWVWNGATLQPTKDILLANGRLILGHESWAELKRRVS